MTALLATRVICDSIAHLVVSGQLPRKSKPEWILDKCNMSVDQKWRQISVHEVDMTKCLILAMEEWVEKKNKEKIVVEKINLKIGEFTCVEPISLINTFNAAVLGSWLDSSEITIETIPFEGKCSKCNRSCLLYTSPSPRDKRQSRMPSSA